MNVKFKMPKFGRKLTGGGMVKELLLTTLATTISIVLTFGTAHFLDLRQAEQTRRLMALTLINDIDETLAIVRGFLESEETGYNITLHLMDNIDRLGSISNDTLQLFFDYVTPSSFTQQRQFMKNNNNILTLSQDSWRTLSDQRFFYLVQDFYNYKALLDRQLDDDVAFQKPFTKEELSRMLMDTDEMSTREGYVSTCRSMLKSVRVKRYTDYHAQRVDDYQYFLGAETLANEENKFLMNITEQDMEDFVKGTHMKVRKVSDSDLMGTWKFPSPVDNYHTTFEYRKDHTFTMHRLQYWRDDTFKGRMAQRYSIGGTWTIEGDSLIKVFDLDSYKMEVVDSGVTYKPNQATAVEMFKKELYKMPDNLKSLEPNPRVSQAINIDESGTRLQVKDMDAYGPYPFRKIKME